MIDFHTHIIPNFDDGAVNTEMALEMLRNSFDSGVDTVISTSHFYPKGNDSLVRFLNKRHIKLDNLKQEILNANEKTPNILKAAEVNISVDFSDYKYIEKLCIENTDYMLLEMPYTKWDAWVFDTIYSLIVKGFKPIIAHIERYKDMKKSFYNLYDMDILYQLNSDVFLSSSGRLWAAELIKNGHAHVIGSDMHNTSSRSSKLVEAYNIIGKKFGEEYAEFFDNNAKNIINNKSIDKKGAEKLSKISKLSLIF